MPFIKRDEFTEEQIIQAVAAARLEAQPTARLERVVERFERLLAAGYAVVGRPPAGPADIWALAEEAEAFIEQKRAGK